MREVTIINRQYVWMEYTQTIEISDEEFEQLEDGELTAEDLFDRCDCLDERLLGCEENEFEYEEY